MRQILGSIQFQKHCSTAFACSLLAVYTLLVDSATVLAQQRSQLRTKLEALSEVSEKIAGAISVKDPPILDGDVVGDPAMGKSSAGEWISPECTRGRSARHGANGGPHHVHAGHDLLRCHLLRQRSRVDYRQ